MGSREKQKEKTRKKIIDTAIDILMDPDVSSLNTNDVAEQAGVSKGLIFHYFTSKDELILAVLEALFDQLLLEIAVKNNNQDPRSVLYELTKSSIELMLNNSHMTSLLYQAMIDIKDNSQLASLEPFLENFLEKSFGQLHPIFINLGWDENNVRMATRLYIAAIDGLGLQIELTKPFPTLTQTELDLDTTVEMIVDLFDKR